MPKEKNNFLKQAMIQCADLWYKLLYWCTKTSADKSNLFTQNLETLSIKKIDFL